MPANAHCDWGCLMGFRVPYAEGAFGLDKTTKRRGRGDKEPAHLAYLRKLPCLVCGSSHEVEAAHIRMASAAHGKPSTAMAQKPPDRFCVPLCAVHHRTGPDAQHSMSEKDFWDKNGIEPCGIALGLKMISGDIEAGTTMIAATRLRSVMKGR